MELWSTAMTHSAPATPELITSFNSVCWVLAL